MTESYRLVNLCAVCAPKRMKRKPIRAVETLLPASLKYCADCVNLEECGAFRDYGSGEVKP